MKNLITALLLFCAATAQAGVFVGFGASAAPVSYLINEDFEGTGTPADWTVVSGTVDFDYATGCPSGSQCVSLGAGSVIQTPTLSSAVDELWVMLRVRLTGTITTNTSFVGVYAEDAVRSAIPLRYNPRFGAFAAGVVEGYGSDVSKDTWYYLLHRSVRGTGTDSIGTTWYSTDGSTWTQAFTVTTGMNVSALDNVRIENDNGADIIVVDLVQLSESDPR